MIPTVFATLPSAALAQRVAAALSARPVPSPCCQVCRIAAPHGRCEGCLRTLDEIAAWSRLDDTAKRAVWQALPSRQESPRR